MVPTLVLLRASRDHLYQYPPANCTLHAVQLQPIISTFPPITSLLNQP